MTAVNCSKSCKAPRCFADFSLASLSYGVGPWGSDRFSTSSSLPVDVTTLSQLLVRQNISWAWRDTAPPRAPGGSRRAVRFIHDFFLTSVRPNGTDVASTITDEIVINFASNPKFPGFQPPGCLDPHSRCGSFMPATVALVDHPLTVSHLVARLWALRTFVGSGTLVAADRSSEMQSSTASTTTTTGTRTTTTQSQGRGRATRRSVGLVQAMLVQSLHQKSILCRSSLPCGRCGRLRPPDSGWESYPSRLNSTTTVTVTSPSMRFRASYQYRLL